MRRAATASRGAIEALADVVPLSLADDGAALRLTAGGGRAGRRSAADEEQRPAARSSRRGLGQPCPGEASIAYHDPERDYQTGLQRAVAAPAARATPTAARLPAALSAGAAKALAEYRLAALVGRAGDGDGRGSAGAAAALRPGRPGRGSTAQAGRWRVTRWTLGPMAVTLELVRVPAPAAARCRRRARAGRSASPICRTGRPSLRLLDLPLGDGPGARPLLFVGRRRARRRAGAARR